MKAGTRMMTVGALVLSVLLGVTAAVRAGRSAVAGRLAPGSASPRVLAGEFLIAAASGRLLVVDARGRMLWGVPGSVATPAHTVQGLELAPDRRGAFASIYRYGDAWLYAVDLASGHKHRIAHAASPTLSPGRRTLAYISLTGPRNGVTFESALVVRNLRTSQTRSIPFPPGVALGNPPDLVINWSPDGRRIATFDGKRIRFVDVAHARDVASQPALAGEGERVLGGRSPLKAPVYVGAHTLLVLANCCIGRQHLVKIDYRSGKRTRFATLPAPDEQIRRVDPNTVFVVTAADELARISHERVRALATGVTAAAT